MNIFIGSTRHIEEKLNSFIYIKHELHYMYTYKNQNQVKLIYV